MFGWVKKKTKHKSTTKKTTQPNMQNDKKSLCNIWHRKVSTRTLASLKWQSYLLGWDRHSSSPLSASCIHRRGEKQVNML